jgi:hypothetical protein
MLINVKMLFLLCWLLGFNLSISTINSITCILLFLFNFSPIINLLNIASYLLFDIMTKRLKRKSEITHHVLGLISIVYVIVYTPLDLALISKILACLETSTIFLNMYHDSKSFKPEVAFVSKLLSTKVWSYVFLLSFIICRFVLFIFFMYPKLDRQDFVFFYYAWLGLNSYWLLWMVNKFIFKFGVYDVKNVKSTDNR